MISASLSRSPAFSSLKELPPNVLVRMMSEPASTYAAATALTVSGSSMFHFSGASPAGSPRAANCVPQAPSEISNVFSAKRSVRMLMDSSPVMVM